MVKPVFGFVYSCISNINLSDKGHKLIDAPESFESVLVLFFSKKIDTKSIMLFGPTKGIDPYNLGYGIILDFIQKYKLQGKSITNGSQIIKFINETRKS